MRATLALNGLINFDICIAKDTLSVINVSLLTFDLLLESTAGIDFLGLGIADNFQSLCQERHGIARACASTHLNQFTLTKIWMFKLVLQTLHHTLENCLHSNLLNDELLIIFNENLH